MFTPLPWGGKKTQLWAQPWAQKAKFWKNEKKPPTEVPKVSKNIIIQNQKLFGAPTFNPEDVCPLPWGGAKKNLKKFLKLYPKILYAI